VLGENGILKQLTKAVLEGAMQAELRHHLGYEKPSVKRKKQGNSRNGKSRKTLKPGQACGRCGFYCWRMNQALCPVRWFPTCPASAISAF
jgi:ribosomal protein S21